MIRPDLGKTEDYLPVGGQNISHFGREKVRGINALFHIEAPPENPRVGGSIPPLATIKLSVRSQDFGNTLADARNRWVDVDAHSKSGRRGAGYGNPISDCSASWYHPASPSRPLPMFAPV
jgi:hypothetical protein